MPTTPNRGFPSRIVLSRKGVDTTKVGGSFQSLIVNGKLINFPIPQYENGKKEAARREHDSTYADLSLRGGCIKNLGDAFGQLPKRNLKANRIVHPDPDIRPEFRPSDTLRGCERTFFGQDGSPYKELENRKVGTGSLFLYFGRFREVDTRNPNRWVFTGRPKHVIWGWQQIDEVVDLRRPPAPPDAKHHPHVVHSDCYNHHENRLFIGKGRLKFRSELHHAGTFKEVRPELILTANHDAFNSDVWDVPEFFLDDRVAMNRKGRTEKVSIPSNFRPARGKVASFAGQGQEFVFNTEGYEDQFRAWLDTLYRCFIT